MAEDQILAADVHQHRRGDLTRECPFRFVMAVLSTQLDWRLSQRSAYRFEVDTRRTDRNFHIGKITCLRRKRRGQLDRLSPVQVHLPVSGDERTSHALARGAGE